MPKASSINDIKCGISKNRGWKCPKTMGNKARGIHKCYGCPNAYWAKTGKRYGRKLLK